MIILSKDTFPIKADYYYYIYLKEKKMMNYNQKIRFLKNKVLKLLGKDGNMTKYMVILELESLHLKGQTNKLLKSLIKP